MVEGVVVRAIERGDVPALVGIAQRAEEADGFPFRSSESELGFRLFPSEGDAARDTRVFEVDGTPVAFGVVEFSAEDGDHRRAVLYGEVDPPHRGRGIGRELLAWQLDRATERIGGADQPRPAFARVYRGADEPKADRLMARFGLAPVRWFEDLLRPLEPPLVVAPPDGVEILAWDQDRTDELLAVCNAAFADHWGSVPLSTAQWRDLLTADEHRPDLSVMATADGAIIGLSRNEFYAQDEQLSGRRDGWIAQLATLREWRGRGVASALIAASLDRFRDAGFNHAMLGVDRENLSGAAGLYRRLGFEPTYQSVCYERRVTPR